jgi:hypothetical protein
MKVFRAVVILALFLPVGVSWGCAGGGGNASINAASSNPTLENANSVKSNTEELQLLIKVPYPIEDEDIVWKDNAAHKKLTAVLRFSKEDTNKLVAEAAARQAPEKVNLSSESWFPPELIAQSDMSGDASLNGVAYSADSFFQEPYTSGRIVRIDGTDYFVLELAAK